MPVRVLSVILSALTMLLIVSAAWRMCRYIDAYGLSFLRLLTFLVMAVIACAMVLCVIKAVRPDFKIFPVLAVFALALWLCFSVTDTSRIIASYNVNAYLSGHNQSMDVDYLYNLSPSVVPELKKLEDADDYKVRRDAEKVIESFESEKYSFWTWTFDRLSLGK